VTAGPTVGRVDIADSDVVAGVAPDAAVVVIGHTGRTANFKGNLNSR
jgi:hypothetical protein